MVLAKVHYTDVDFAISAHIHTLEHPAQCSVCTVVLPYTSEAGLEDSRNQSWPTGNLQVLSCAYIHVC
jgi:hypothetical protein